MATIDAKKLLPPSKKTENSEKFLVPVTSIVPKRSVTLSANALRPVDKPADAGTSVSPSDNLVGKIVKVENILKSNLALQIKEGTNKDREEKNKETEEKEKKLEIKQDKKSKVPLPSLPKIGFLDALKNYFINTLLGFVAVKLFDMAPKLIKFLDATKPIITFIGFLGKNLFDGFVGFIENGYKAYDEVRKFTKTVGGENAQKTFDEFSKKLNLVLNGAIVAAGLAISTAPRTPAGRTGAGTGVASGAVKGASQLLGSGSLSRANASFSRYSAGNANIGDRARLLRRGYIGGRQALSKGGEKALQQGAAKKSAQEVAKQAATQGAKQSARFAITKAPIIGALIGFIIDTVIFKEKPTRAAAGAVGNAIGSAVGAGLLGGGTFGLGAGVGLFVGGFVGDWIGKSLYDTIASFNQQPVQGRAQGGQISTGGRTGTPTRSIKKTRRPVKRITPQKTQPGKDSGGLKKIEELYGKDEPGTRSALRALKKSSQEVKRVKSINGLSGAMFGAGIDMALGQKPDKNLARSLGDMFGSVVQNAIDVEMNSAFSDITKTLAMANGGVVPQRGLRDNMNIGERIGRYVSNAFSVAIENSSSKVFENLKKELNLEGGPPGGPGGGPGGGLVPGSAGAPGQTFNIAQLVTLAKRAGFRGNNAAIAAAIAMAESSGNSKAHNTKPPDNSYGLWQINMIDELGPDRRRKYGLSSNEELFDPAVNANIAYKMSGGSNFSAWTTFTKGKYLGFLPDAQNALRRGDVELPRPVSSPVAPPAMVTGGTIPSLGYRTSAQGERWGRQHKGTDYDFGDGAPISSAQDATVVWAGDKGDDYGNSVVLKYSNGAETRFAHLQSPLNVKKGQLIKAGQLLGRQGSTGRSTASHLHYEYYPNGGAMSYSGQGNSEASAASYFRVGGNVKPILKDKPSNIFNIEESKNKPSSIFDWNTQSSIDSTSLKQSATLSLSKNVSSQTTSVIEDSLDVNSDSSTSIFAIQEIHYVYA